MDQKENVNLPVAVRGSRTLVLKILNDSFFSLSGFNSLVPHADPRTLFVCFRYQKLLLELHHFCVVYIEK